MEVDLKGLAQSVDAIRAELLEEAEHEERFDHRPGVLYTAVECIRQIADVESECVSLRELIGDLSDYIDKTAPDGAWWKDDLAGRVDDALEKEE